MVMTFPESSRMIYPKTFLKDVRLMLLFKETEKKSIEALKAFFEKHFGAPEINLEELKGGIQFSSNTSPVAVSVKNGWIEVMISRPLYKRFDQMKDWLPAMFEYIKASGANAVERIIIIKYNELDFTHVQKDFPVANVMKQVLHEHLISAVDGSDFEKFNSLSRWEKMLNFGNVNEGPYEAGIEFGFRRKSDPDKLNGSITLKTLIACSLNEILDNVNVRISEMNNIIDDMFHWSISASIIETMK